MIYDVCRTIIIGLIIAGLTKSDIKEQAIEQLISTGVNKATAVEMVSGVLSQFSEAVILD